MTSTGSGDGPPIVIGYDGSEFAKHAIQEAARLFPGRRAAARARGRARRRGEIAGDGGQQLVCTDRIADEQDALAVVVGSRGLSRLKEMLLGSTSSGLLHHSARPVVVVP